MNLDDALFWSIIPQIVSFCSLRVKIFISNIPCMDGHSDALTRISYKAENVKEPKFSDYWLLCTLQSLTITAGFFWSVPTPTPSKSQNLIIFRGKFSKNFIIICKWSPNIFWKDSTNATLKNYFENQKCLFLPKYGFCKKSLRKDAPLPSWTLFSSLWFQISADLESKWRKKGSTGQRCIFPRWLLTKSIL